MSSVRPELELVDDAPAARPFGKSGRAAPPVVVGGDVAADLARELGAPHVAVEPTGASDPYGIRRLVADPGFRVDAVGGVLVVAGRARSVRAVPGPVIGGCPVGLLFAGRSSDLDRWLDARERSRGLHGAARKRPTVVVASMYSPFYERVADAVLDRLAGLDPVDLRARHHDRGDLVDAIADGPSVVVYLGHGRWRGWSGYRGVRWSHFERPSPPVRSAGLVISLSCDALKRPNGKPAFGARMVADGWTTGFLGSPCPLRIDDGFELAMIVANALAARPASSGALLQRVDAAAAGTPQQGEAAKLRLVGSPSSPLVV